MADFGIGGLHAGGIGEGNGAGYYNLKLGSEAAADTGKPRHLCRGVEGLTTKCSQQELNQTACRQQKYHEPSWNCLWTSFAFDMSVDHGPSTVDFFRFCLAERMKALFKAVS